MLTLSMCPALDEGVGGKGAIGQIATVNVHRSHLILSMYTETIMLEVGAVHAFKRPMNLLS